MKSVFILISLISLCSQAQTDFQRDNQEYYREWSVSQMPKGTNVIFQKEVVLKAKTEKVKVAGFFIKDCFFSISNAKDFDQVIPAGTKQTVKESGDSWSGIDFGGNNGARIYCEKDYLTIGEFADVLKNVVTFNFPAPPEPRKLEF